MGNIRLGKRSRDVEEDGATVAQLVQRDEFSAQGEDGTYIILDLGREECGFVDLDIGAAAGTVVDIAIGEHLVDRIAAAVDHPQPCVAIAVGLQLELARMTAEDRQEMVTEMGLTVMDTGGSSGRLREELAVLPPGDVRNCLLALAEDEARILPDLDVGEAILSGQLINFPVLVKMKEPESEGEREERDAFEVLEEAHARAINETRR